MDRPDRAALFGLPNALAKASMTSQETELEMVSRHVRESNGRIARQRQIIGDLCAKSRSTVLAEDVLVLFEEAQALHEAHLKRT